MRRVIPFLASVATLVAVASSAQAAQLGPYDKFCLQGPGWGYPGNCQFATYEQCLATASGTEAYCDINPVWAFAAAQTPPLPEYRVRKAPRSHHHSARH